MYSRTRSDTLYDHVLRVCRAYNFYPNIIQETYEMPTTLALVAAGLGVALVPQSDSIVKIDGVISRKLDTTLTVWQVGAIWRKEEGQPLTEAFLKVLNAELKSTQSRS
jgi:DNA-binding transcriptional LysR family regulator